MQPKPHRPTSLPFELGEARSSRSLTVVPLFAAALSQVEYVGLDEAAAKVNDLVAEPHSVLFESVLLELQRLRVLGNGADDILRHP